MRRAVFINYRGEDSHSYGALLHRELTSHFGEDLVFLDAESIPAGADFAEELLSHVRSARVLLAVIGQRWLTVTDPTTGRRRIDDPADWIRRELAEAFVAGVRVIPVLTDDAELPRETDLPAGIAALSRCQYRRLRRREPTSDLARIVADLTSLDPVLAAAAHSRDTAPRGTGKTAPALASAPTPPVEEYLRLLATASRNQWTAAANDRRLRGSRPVLREASNGGEIPRPTHLVILVHGAREDAEARARRGRRHPARLAGLLQPQHQVTGSRPGSTPPLPRAATATSASARSCALNSCLAEAGAGRPACSCASTGHTP